MSMRKCTQMNEYVSVKGKVHAMCGRESGPLRGGGWEATHVMVRAMQLTHLQEPPHNFPGQTWQLSVGLGPKGLHRHDKLHAYLPRGKGLGVGWGGQHTREYTAGHTTVYRLRKQMCGCLQSGGCGSCSGSKPKQCFEWGRVGEALWASPLRHTSKCKAGTPPGTTQYRTQHPPSCPLVSRAA